MKRLIPSEIKLLPDKPGVYQIFVFSKRNEPIKIRRFAGIDESGLLYIGRTIRQTLQKRLSNFEITHREQSKTNNHSGALKYRKVHIIQKTLKDHNLFFTYQVCKDPALEEKLLLIEYREKFGETPPLNG